MKKNNFAFRITNFALVNPTPPTPPTPPTMDKGDGENNNHAKIDAKQLLGIRKENSTENISEGGEEVSEETAKTSPPQSVEKKESPSLENMARDAVANGAGPLTKRTVEKPQEKKSQDTAQTEQKNSQLPPSLNFAMTEDDKGKEVLKQFQLDENISTEQKTPAESPRIVRLNSNEEHGGIYWAFALILAVVLAVVFVKKFLLTDKPKLKKSDLFDDSEKKLKNVSEKITKPTKNYSPPKVSQPVKLKSSKTEDDDKGKHFEIRV